MCLLLCLVRPLTIVLHNRVCWSSVDCFSLFGCLVVGLLTLIVVCRSGVQQHSSVLSAVQNRASVHQHRMFPVLSVLSFCSRCVSPRWLCCVCVCHIHNQVCRPSRDSICDQAEVRLLSIFVMFVIFANHKPFVSTCADVRWAASRLSARLLRGCWQSLHRRYVLCTFVLCSLCCLVSLVFP